MLRNKNKLKKIAERHAKGILIATDNSNFHDPKLSGSEISYIVDQIHKIANKITKDPPAYDNQGGVNPDIYTLGNNYET